jgi:outer membrane biosynthesis protein TonB
MEDRFFKYAVIVSLILHCCLFVKLYLSPQKKEVQQRTSELAYHLEPAPPEPQMEALTPNDKAMSFEPSVANAKVDTTASREIKGPESLFKDGADLASQFKVFERAPEKVKGLKVTKEVSIPVLKSEKINTPAYATYYQIVRDRIRDRAYTNYTKLSVGEVYLTFIIKSDGTLTALQILENKSEANEFLRSVGMKSVQEAGPFPPFPKDLGYPELTFNVQISFQYHEGE